MQSIDYPSFELKDGSAGERSAHGAAVVIVGDLIPERLEQARSFAS